MFRATLCGGAGCCWVLLGVVGGSVVKWKKRCRAVGGESAVWRYATRGVVWCIHSILALIHVEHDRCCVLCCFITLPFPLSQEMFFSCTCSSNHKPFSAIIHRGRQAPD